MNAQSRDLKISLPVEIVNEINSQFPDVSHKTIKQSRETTRNILCYQIYRAIHNKHAQVSIHQGLIDNMYGSRQRKALMGVLNDLRFFRRVKKHVAGIQTSIWQVEHPELKGRNRASIDGPHAMMSPSWMPWWMFGCDSFVVLGADWITVNRKRYEFASHKLWNVSHQYREHLESNLESVVISPLSLSECTEGAAMSKESKLNLAQKAEIYRREWNAFADDPLRFCFRKSGRLYYPMVNQPKALRRRHLQFHWKGELVPMAEVDLRSSYWAFLLAMLEPTEDVSQLAKDLEDGLVYERLAESCTSQTWKDRQALKVAAQIQCLFGDSGFGQQPLFGALHSRYPTLAAFIRGVRCRAGSGQTARKLSKLLTEAEGSFFIDTLLPELTSIGIPALPLHDAVIVPVTVAEEVRIIAEAAIRKIGIPGRFSVTIPHQNSHGETNGNGANNGPAICHYPIHLGEFDTSLR